MLAAYQLHSIKHATIRERTDIMHRNDTGMFEPGDDLCLPHHAARERRFIRLRTQNLYGYLAIEIGILGQINSAHAALTQFSNQTILGAAEVRLRGNAPESIQFLVR